MPSQLKGRCTNGMQISFATHIHTHTYLYVHGRVPSVCVCVCVLARRYYLAPHSQSRILHLVSKCEKWRQITISKDAQTTPDARNNQLPVAMVKEKRHTERNARTMSPPTCTRKRLRIHGGPVSWSNLNGSVATIKTHPDNTSPP